LPQPKSAKKFPFSNFGKFKKTIEECRSLHDKLLFSLRNMHKLKEQPKQLKGTFFDMLFSVAEFSSFSPMELTEYMSRTMARFDRSAQLEYAKDTGIKAGMRKGRKLGIEQGREEGITQTAKNMLAKGYSIADIIGITDLSREQIKALKRGLMPTH
jgi:predicted transposase/invertase (TIGR01784 family)